MVFARSAMVRGSRDNPATAAVGTICRPGEEIPNAQQFVLQLHLVVVLHILSILHVATVIDLTGEISE